MRQPLWLTYVGGGEGARKRAFFFSVPVLAAKGEFRVPL
ncbi:Uncharacterized protein pbN1_31600 [Aromatoleum bremense]|nr:Uncharacterized protein pbN1_31600 [Aromatoleum bremense]